MFFFWGALLAAGASYLASQEGAKTQGKFNAKEADKNRAFQERMSGSAYQRAADDLEAAGLNRVLALGSPAATPSGAQAAIEAPQLGSAISTGIQAASAKQQIEQSKAEEKFIKEREQTERDQQHLLRHQSEQSATQSELNEATTRYTNAKAIKEERYSPVHEAVGDMAQSSIDFVRNSAKDIDIKSIKDIPTKARQAIERKLKSWADAYNRRKNSK